MQRSRLRRSQAIKKLRGRVVNVKDLAQWQKMLNILGDKLLVAHFFAVRPDRLPLSCASSDHWTLLLADRMHFSLMYHVSTFMVQPWSSQCKQMRSFLNDISSRPAYAHVVFAELDVDNDSIKVIGLALMKMSDVQHHIDWSCADVLSQLSDVLKN
jgi:hypothetical protein